MRPEGEGRADRLSVGAPSGPARASTSGWGGGLVGRSSQPRHQPDRIAYLGVVELLMPQQCHRAVL
jgi:hypothetical protein